MAIFGQQSKNVIFSDAKSAVLKKKAGQIKYNPDSALPAQSCLQPFYIRQLLGCSSPNAVQNEVFQHTLMLQTTFKSFSFCCNIEPKQTLKSQKLQQNSFVIPPGSFNPHPRGAWWQDHRYTQGYTSSVSSCSFTHCATRRWGKPQTPHISPGKIIPGFSPPEGEWGKTTCEGGLQPALHM